MKRKLVRQGAATLMISLPASWLKENHLSKGNEVDLSQEGNLIVVGIGQERTKQTSVELRRPTRSSLRIAVMNAYRTGFDTIRVKIKNESELTALRDTLENYLLGFDIVKRDGDWCIIQNITEPSADQFDNIFRKVFQNIKLLLAATEQRMVSGRTAEDYQLLVMKTHQYDNYCRRIVAKRGVRGIHSNLIWSFLSLLTHGQRELYHLHRFREKSPFRIKKSLIFDLLSSTLHALETSFITRQPVHLEAIHDAETAENYALLYKQLQKGGKEAVALYHLMAAWRNFYHAASPLMGVLLEEQALAQKA